MVAARTLFIGLLTAASIAPASANPFIIEAEQPAFTSTFALRYWYGMGDASLNLYGSGGALNSRLTYDGITSHSAEVAFRVDATESSLFFKGYAGGGLLTKGSLNDEDFPPAITPYSSTNSTLQNQTLGYLSFDVGGAILRGADFRLDGFVGYHFLNENMKAFGCTQVAGNTSVCNPAIPADVAGIQQESTWQSLRLGLAAEVPVFDRLRLNVEGAWLPYVWMNGADTHILRVGSAPGDFTGPIPEDGHGWGYQFEAVLTYKITDSFDLGIGGRYWHMQSRGLAHFENHIVGFAADPQPLDWKSDHYGVFLQGSYKFSM